MDIKIEFNKRFGMPIYIPLISLVLFFTYHQEKIKKFIHIINIFIFLLDL